MASVSKADYRAVLDSLNAPTNAYQMAMEQQGNTANGQALAPGYVIDGLANEQHQGIDTTGWSQDQIDRLNEMQDPNTGALNSQNLLDAIKVGSGSSVYTAPVDSSKRDLTDKSQYTPMSVIQEVAQNGLDPTQGPGQYNMLSDAAYLNAGGGLKNQMIGNANNVSNWAQTTDYDELMDAGSLDAARTHTMNQYATGAITAEEAQERENAAFEQHYGSLEHSYKENERSGGSVLSGESWVQTTITPTDYSSLTPEQAFLQAEHHNNIDSEFVSVEGLGGQLFKMAVTGALTAGVGAALAPTMVGLSAGAQGAINGGLNSAIGGVVSGNGLDIKDIGVGALTGGVGGSLSNADGMLGGFIDTGSNLADDAIKGAITGGIGGAIDGDVLGGALTGGVSGAGMNLLEQGVGWAGDKIGGLKDDLTGPGEFDFANDVVGFEDDIFYQDLQAFEDSFDFINSTEWDLDDQMNYDTAYDSLQEIVPGGEYREGIQFSEMNNWVTADGQVVDRNDIGFNQEIGEFTIEGTDTIVNEHPNAITIDGQVVAYKDGESWTDINGEPVTDPALVDFYTNQSTQSGDMEMIQEATHDTMTWDTGNGQESAYQTSDGKWHLTGSDGTVEINPDTVGQVGYIMGEDGKVYHEYTGEVVANQGPSGDWYGADGKIDDINSFVSNGTNTAVRTEGTGNQILDYSDNYGANAFYNNPDYKGTILGESTQTSPGNNYTATDGSGWGINTGDTNIPDPGAVNDVYYNLDNGFYNPNATNNAETNFLPPEEIEEIVEQQQQQEDASESDPVNNTDTSLDTGEVGGGQTGTPSESVDTAVGTIVAELQQEQLQAILSQNPALAQEIAEQIADVIAQNQAETEATSETETETETESEAETESESESESESETTEESESETETTEESETETGSTPTNNDPSPAENNATPGATISDQIAELIASIKAAGGGAVGGGGGGGSVDGGDNASGDPNGTPGGQNTNENGGGGLTDGDATGDGDDTGTGVQTGDGTGTGDDGDKGGDGEGAGDPGIGAGFGGLLAGLGAGAGSGGSGDRPLWTVLDEITRLPGYKKLPKAQQASINEGLMQAAKAARRTA